MPGFFDCLWWLILGGFVGWVLFWLIDVGYRRDGEVAGAGDKAKIESLTTQADELSEERDALRKQLDDSRSDAQRNSGLLESLRESNADQGQQISSLEAALAAAREPQRTSRAAAAGLTATGLGAAVAASPTNSEPVAEPAAGPSPDQDNEDQTADSSSVDPDDRAPITLDAFENLFSDKEDADAEDAGPELGELDELSARFPSLDESQIPDQDTPSANSGGATPAAGSVFSRLSGQPEGEAKDSKGGGSSRLFGRLGGTADPSSNSG